MTEQSLDAKISKDIENLQRKLLNLSAANPLLNFHHGERNVTHIRIIDELPNELFLDLCMDGREFYFKPLPPIPTEPADEQRPEFISKFEQERLIDETFQEGIKVLEEKNLSEDDYESELKKLERKLKDKIREEIGLPSRKNADDYTNTQWAKKQGLNPSYEMPLPNENEQTASKHTDKYIQTLLFQNEMDRRLNALKRKIDNDLDEMGVNTFYAAFGFLEFIERTSKRKQIAPLILLPLNPLQRKNERGKQKFAVSSTGEFAETNETLKVKLKEYGVLLPDFDVDIDTVESYFKKIEKLISDQKDWSVRRFITFGRFMFSNLVMYQDLTSKDWAGGIQRNKTIRDLLAGSQQIGDFFVTNPHKAYPIDGNKDVDRYAPILILDADSSQHSAIIDAMRGDNLVIFGPPGTGKSQTITNIIANALFLGKKVLFVAEKMAALNVVYSRLKAAGLESLCLELHSTKSKLKDLVPKLNLSVSDYNKNHGKNDIVSEKIIKLQEDISRLREASSCLNACFKKTECSLFDIIWGWQHQKRIISSLPHNIVNRIRIDKASSLSFSDMKRFRKELENYIPLFKSAHSFGSVKQHPWAGIPFEKIGNLAASSILTSFDDANKRLKEISEDINSFSLLFDWSFPDSFEHIEKAIDVLKNIKKLPIESLYSCCVYKCKSNDKDELKTFKECIDTYDRISKKYAEKTVNFDALVKQKEKIFRILSEDQNDFIGLSSSEMQNAIEMLSKIRRNWSTFIREYKNRISITNHTLSLEDFCTVLQEADIFQCLPQEIKECVDINSEQALKNASRAKKDLDRIFSIKAEIESFMDVDSDDFTDEFISEYDIYSNGGLFSFLSSKYRKAKKRIYQRLNSPETVKDKKLFSDIIKKANILAHAQKSFLENEIYRKTASDLYDGLSTNFSGMVAVINFFIDLAKKYGRNSAVYNFFEKEDDAAIRFVAKTAMETEMGKVFQYLTVDSIDEFSDEIFDAEKKRLENIYSFVTENMKEGFRLTELNLKDFEEAISAKKWCLDNSDYLRNLLGDDYAEIQTNSSLIADQLYIQDELDEIELKNTILKGKVSEILEQILERLLKLKNDLADWFDNYFSLMNEAVSGGIDEYFQMGNMSNISVKTIENKISFSLSHRDTLSSFIAFKKMESSFLNGKKIEQICQQLTANMFRELNQIDLVPDLFEYLYYDSVIKEVTQNSSEYPDLDTPYILKRLVDEFNELDKEVLKLNAERVRINASKGQISQGCSVGAVSSYSEAGLIKHFLSKNGKMRRITLRDLIKRAPHTLQTLFPCFLMSPHSVAQYLSPNKIKFDLVIIDEASQMPPENAIGSIARASQAVIVGDQKQLPPTAFFKTTESGSDDDWIDEDDESILDKATAKFATKSWLSWHYRSRHESLIAFSNSRFYENSLTVFPAPNRTSPQTGVSYEYIENGIYKNRCNINEAKRVIKAIRDFIYNSPDRSLGVGTTNGEQRKLLERMYDDLCMEDKKVEEYRKKHADTLEPFFIKNLENIQGDERDSIFISTVYGPETEGGKVNRRFGPINGAQGYRRLNVLFTRAKHNLRVFSSMKPDDIEIPDETPYENGARVLKEYLKYASSQDRGGINLKGNNDDEGGSFSLYLKEILSENGYHVVEKVGVNGFFIDLAVVDPEDPSRFIAGIECDGPSYDESKSTRDRDRIKPDVLTGLGWSLYRVWSLDWFRDVKTETTHLIDFLKDAEKNTRELPALKILSDDKKNEESDAIFDEIDVEEKNVDQKCEEKGRITPKIGDTVSFYYDNEVDKIKTVIISSVTDFNNNKIIETAPLCKALKECAIGETASYEIEDNRTGDTILRYITVIGIDK